MKNLKTKKPKKEKVMKIKKFFKSIVPCVMLALVALFFVSCSDSKGIDSVGVVASSIPTEILNSEVDQKLGDIKIKVTKKDGTKEEVAVTKDMISAEDLAKLNAAGSYLIAITYEGFTVKINVTITEPAKEAEGDTITFTNAIIEENLKTLEALPAEYDLYVYLWGTSVEGKFYPISTATTFVAPEGCDNVIFLIMPVGAQANWDNKLDQTNDLKIINGAVGVPTPVAPGELVDFTVATTDIVANLKPNGTETELPTLPETYDIHAWVWGGTEQNVFKPVVGGKFTADEGTTGCLFVLMETGVAPSWDAKICQTKDFTIAWKDTASSVFCGTTITFSEDLLVEENLAPDNSFPTEEYDLWFYVWGGSVEDRFIPFAFSTNDAGETEATVAIPTGTTGGIIVLIAKDQKGGWGTQKLAQTVDLEVTADAGLIVKVTPPAAE